VVESKVSSSLVIAESKEERRKRKEDGTPKPVAKNSEPTIDLKIKNAQSPHALGNSQVSPSNLIGNYN
jgi:hypothetical protein